MKTIKINEHIIFVITDTQTTRIMRSGWNDEFHCIIEDGELTTVSYELLNVEQIRNKFGNDAADLLVGITDNYSKQNIIKNDEGTLN